jgi:predicted aspartyl protease
MMRGHLHADMTVKGSKAAVKLKNVLIDTGATYTILPEEILEEVGAWGPMPRVEVTLGNSRKVKAKAYGVAIKIKGVEAPAISLTFKDAQTVIGVETLESLGMKLDPARGKLEFTRPRGRAYFFSAVG